MSHLFWERAALISARSFLAKRSTPEESIQFGLDTILEVFPILSHSKKHILEHACCCVDAGWLYVLQSEYLDNIQNNSIREQAITYLERAVSLLKDIRKLTSLSTTVLISATHKKDVVTRAGSYLTFNPQVPASYPNHIKLMASGFSLAYLEGCSYYLLGRLHQGWITVQIRNPSEEEQGEENYNSAYYGGGNKKREDTNTELYNYNQAFEYLSTSVRPKFLTIESAPWADAHHRIASIIIKYPVIVDSDYIVPVSSNQPNYIPSNALPSGQKNSDLYLDSAIQHLAHSLRSSLLTSNQSMDINFHKAQAHITKLQMIIDSIPYGESVTKALIQTDSLDTIELIERHLKEAVRKVTAASTQSTQDGYLYFYSCLKVSEYRMLEAACKPDLTSRDRAAYLKDSIEYLIDALMSRPLVDNIDLHYIATAQMSAMLLSCRKTFAACKSLCKTLLCLSTMINRSMFNPETAAQLKLWDELNKQSSATLFASGKDIFWVKRHFGPVSLNERLTAGYATWSFEDGPNVKPTFLESDSSNNNMLVSPTGGGGGIGFLLPLPFLAPLEVTTQALIALPEESQSDGGDDQTGTSSAMKTFVLNKSAPPKGVPPLKLPRAKQKKITLGGVAVAPTATHSDDEDDEGHPGGADDQSMMSKTSQGLLLKPRPPSGAVPLSALGHHPDYSHSKPPLFGGTAGGGATTMTTPLENQEEPYFYSGPYGRRMRRRIPPLRDMIDIDRKVRGQFGFNKSRAVFLMPAYTPSSASTSTLSKAILQKKQQEKDAKVSNPQASFANTGKKPSAVQNNRKNKHSSDVSVMSDGSLNVGEDNFSEDNNSQARSQTHSQQHNAHHDSDDEEEEEEDEHLSEAIALYDQMADEEGQSREGSDGESDGSGDSEEDSQTVSRNSHHGDDEWEDRELPGKNRPGNRDRNTPYDFASASRKPLSHKVQSKYYPEEKKAPLSKRQQQINAKKKAEDEKGLIKRKTQKVSKNGKPTVMGWLFRSFVNNTKKGAPPPPVDLNLDPQQQSGNVKPTYSFLNPFSKTTVVEESNTIDESVNLWCSTQCFCSFMLLSRISRMQLVMRSRQFHLLDGERVNYTLFHMKPKYVETLKNLRENLYKDCSKIIIPPTTLKEVSQRSYLELQILFKSNVKLCRRLDDWEQFLYYKMSKVDYFIPMIAVLPVFLRDISSYDNTLLNPNKLIVNLTYEEKIENLIQKNEKFNNTKIVANGSSSLNGGVSQFTYDSVSSQQISTVNNSTATLQNATALAAEQSKLRHEEKEEVLAGKMSLSLSQSLDGSNYLRDGQQGIRDMLTTYLAEDECLLTWHLPHAPHHNVQVVLTWRDNSASTHNYYSSAEAYSHTAIYDNLAHGGDRKKRRKNKKNAPNANVKGKYKNKGIVMEIARSDLDTSKLMQLVQNYLSALHSKSAPLRTTMTTDALRALSCALSMTEFLNIIPPHVRSLCINCPAVMRVIPWHLILIEVSRDHNAPLAPNTDVYRKAPNAATGSSNTNNVTFPPLDSSKPVEIHLMEKYCVRLGPTLNIYELVETKAKFHRQSTGMHRMCAVDGTAYDDTERNFGIRGTDVEVACVTHTWSADPQDYHVLLNDHASPRNLQTGLFADGNNEQYKKFKKSIYISRYQSINPIKMKRLKREYVSEEQPETRGKKGGGKATKNTGEIPAEKIFGKMDETTEIKMSATSTKNQYNQRERDDEKSDDSAPVSSSDENDSDDDLEDVRKEGEFNMRALSMCRVLHIAADKVPQSDIKENKMTGDEEDAANSHFEAAVALPKYEKIMTVNNKRVKIKDPRPYLTTSDMIRQIYVKNCSLCVLSKFGTTDDVESAYTKELEINCAFVESAHLAGANTVLHPLWSAASIGHGINTLAQLIFMIRFYSILPAHSKDRISVVNTVRATQLWLRDITADSAIAFIFKAPIPQKARQTIIDEMEAYVNASLTAEEAALKSKLIHDTHVKMDTPFASPGPKGAASGENTPERNHIHPASPAPPSAIAAANMIRENLNKVGGEGGASAAPSVSNQMDGTAGNRVGGDKKFFTHFLSWGAFCVSGHGGAVHHPDLTEGIEDAFQVVDDKDLHNLAYEADVLRMEGKYEDAAALDAYIRRLKAQKVAERVAKMRHAAALAGRGFMDGLDYLDKAFLDQDSDSIIVSSESSESSAPDSDDADFYAVEEEEEDPDDPLNNMSPSGKVKPKFKPKPLELGNLKPENIGYSKWKSKVGSLNLDVKQPVISVQQLVDKRQEAVLKKNREDNYELNMANKTNQKIDGNGNVILETPKKKAKDAAALAALEAADDESSGESDSAIQERRKKERQGKLNQALGEIRSEVRSYSEVVNTLTGAISGGRDKAAGGEEGCVIC
eukprot:gene25126-31545_t